MEKILETGAALTLLGQATGIVKNRRDIDKTFDVAVLNAQMVGSNYQNIIVQFISKVNVTINDLTFTIRF